MENLTISLPPSVKQYLDEQVSAGGYGSASAYIHQLLEQDQDRKWREGVDTTLLEALDSGLSEIMTPKDWEAIRREAHELATRRSRP